MIEKGVHKPMSEHDAALHEFINTWEQNKRNGLKILLLKLCAKRKRKLCIGIDFDNDLS